MFFPKARGLPFRDGSFLQIFVATEFEKGYVDIDLKGILDVTGEEKSRQIHAGFQTSSEWQGIDITGRYEFGLMVLGEDTFTESAYSLTFGKRWE